MTKILKPIWIAASILFVVILALSGYFVFNSPVAFQKSVAIKFVQQNELKLEKPKKYFDVRTIIQGIPYKNDNRTIYEVEPEKKFSKTIIQGYGNCSNLAFGLGYYLGQHDQEYQIVHLMPPDRFLLGGGHTVVNTPYVIDGKRHYGIVDVLEGGLPINNNIFIDLNLLRLGGFDSPKIFSLNHNKDDVSPFYGDFLNEVVIGIIKHDNVASYFNFINAIYLPLGHKWLEKLFYDGVAVIFGYYPTIYVDKNEYEILFNNNKVTRVSAIFLVASIRIFLIFVLSLIVVYLFTMIKNQKIKRKT